MCVCVFVLANPLVPALNPFAQCLACAREREREREREEKRSAQPRAMEFIADPTLWILPLAPSLKWCFLLYIYIRIYISTGVWVLVGLIVFRVWGLGFGACSGLVGVIVFI